MKIACAPDTSASARFWYLELHCCPDELVACVHLICPFHEACHVQPPSLTQGIFLSRVANSHATKDGYTLLARVVSVPTLLSFMLL
eukprot:scaffold102276_cov21-Tisochrysis_lutea.AAC.1